MTVNAHSSHLASPATCPSCGVQSVGRYCPACGEKFLSSSDFSFKHFLLHQVPHEVMHWDGKLGRTLREIAFAPGKMAADYVRGRRQPYLNPLRLYLVVFLVQAFISSIGAPVLSLSARVKRDDVTGLAAKWIGDIPAASDSFAQRVHFEAYTHWLSEAGTLCIFFLVAFAQLLVMRKFHRRYIEHLTLALNVATFTFLLLIVVDGITLVVGRGTISETAGLIRINVVGGAMPIYWCFAIKRFYGTTWGGAILYTIAIAAANIAIATALNLLVLLLLAAAA